MLSASTIRQPITSTELDDISRSILRVLLYFKVFSYPIKKEELFPLVCSDNKIDIQTVLAKLIGEGMVQTKDDFVWVMSTEKIIEERLVGNDKAEKLLITAQRQARILSWFPFIKCICVSGSLSKYYVNDHSDIDYFIIAKKRRLWLTKLLMSLIVETLEIFRLEKYCCPNYIITENNLNINDRNIFTAMEIITLIPLYNKAAYEKFLSENEWVKAYFPYYEMNIPVNSYSYSKKFLRSFWNSSLFTWMDSRIFHFFKRRFANKLRRKKIIAFDNDMVITESDFKLHLSGHRKRILHGFEKNITEFQERFDVIL
jgi:hypothetical protein